MSQENVELHRRCIEAFNARDIEAFIAFCDSSVEWNSTFAAIGGAIYHGHEGIRKWDREWREVWGDEIRAEPEAYFDLGEHTVAFYMLHGRGAQSGAVQHQDDTRWKRERVGPSQRCRSDGAMVRVGVR